MSILPVDQGIEHSAGASFAPNPLYFDPENIVKLAIEGGCNAVASTLGVLGAVSRKYAHKIPFILKFNHNEFLSYPNTYDQSMFASVEQAFEMGAVAVGATVYFGSAESRRQIWEVSPGVPARPRARHGRRSCGATCATTPSSRTATDYHVSADMTGQANHLGVTIEADIIKQKMAGEQRRLQRGQVLQDPRQGLQRTRPPSTRSTSCRYQVASCYMGRAGLINSGGESKGAGDLAQAVRTAVINKRAGGMGLISGRKAFQKPMKEGVALLNAIQDVYLSPQITVA
ncbi:MAG: class I fructose-bisphosphate aldolase [Chromatiales bacterium]|nr:class I fructose-bisphosphate aldolase [Chromatiales bacterium]